MAKEPIVALEKEQEKPREGAQWNNHIVRWLILSNIGPFPKQFEIVLEITYLSSKRVVKVNGE